MAHLFSFHEAINKLLAGFCVRRLMWDPNDQYVEAGPSATANNPTLRNIPLFYLQKSNGVKQPWIIKHSDVLAKDWKVVNSNLSSAG